MWPVSSLWDNAVRNSQVIEVRVDAYRDGVLLASDLPVEPESGTVTADRTADVRRTLDVVIPDPTLIPETAEDVLSPYGTELRVQRGFRYPDGTTELVPVGVFRIDKPAVSLTGGGAVRVTGVDYCRLIAEDMFLNPAQSVTSNTVVQEIQRVIQLAQPGATFIDSSSDTTPCALTNWEQESSRWEAVTELALSIGVDVAPNPEGTWVIRRLPSATDTPVWSVNAGESGVLVDGDEEWDRERIFNGWIVRSEPTDGSNPVQSIVYDNDSSSPTYWSGPFGRRPKVFSSPLLTTTGQCTQVATRLLAQSLQSGRVQRVKCVPNPALEIGDVVSVVTPGRTESDPYKSSQYLIHSFTLPLALGAMEIDVTAPLPGE